VLCQHVIDGRQVRRDVGWRCRVRMMSLATSCGREQKRVGSGWRKMSFDRRRCGRETRWRERERKAGGSRKQKRKTGGRRKHKGFPLHLHPVFNVMKLSPAPDDRKTLEPTTAGTRRWRRGVHCGRNPEQ